MLLTCALLRFALIFKYRSNKENICENGDARHHEDTDDLIQQLEIISEGDAPSDEEYTAGEVNIYFPLKIVGLSTN